MKRLALIFLAAVLPASAACGLFNQVQFFNNSGQPLAGGLIYVTLAGTSTPTPSYTSSTCATPATNPVVLSAGGYGQIWISSTVNYRLTIRTSGGVLIQTLDGVTVGGGGSGTSSWTVSGNNQYSAVSGNVGIGTSAPLEKLGIVGSLDLKGDLKLRNSDATSYVVVQRAAPSGMLADYAVQWPTALPASSGSCLVSTTGGVMSWSASCGGGGGGGGAANYTQTFTSATSATLTHNLNSTGVLIACYDDGTPELLIALTAGYPHLTDANNADVAWTGSKTGHCVVNSSAGNPNLWTMTGNEVTLSDSAYRIPNIIFRDITAGTGVTAIVFQGGDGQASTPITSWNNTSGTQIGSFLEDGTFSAGPGVFSGLLAANSLSSASTLVVGTTATIAGNLTINVTGSTQCLQVNSSGVVSGSGAGCGGGGSSLPVVDTNAIVYKSGTPTAEMGFDLTNISASTLRRLKPQDASYTIAGLEQAQTFTATQTMRDVFPSVTDTYRIGEQTSGTTCAGGPCRWYEVNANRINGISTGGSISNNYLFTRSIKIYDALGGSGNWSMAAAASGTSSAMSFTDNGSVDRLVLRTTSSGITVTQADWALHQLPVTTDMYDIGSSSARWANGYFTNINVSGTCTGCTSGGANTALSNLSSVAINSDLLFPSSNARSLGTTSAQALNVVSQYHWSCDSSTTNCWKMFSSTSGTNSLTFQDGSSANRFSLSSLGALVLGTSSGTNYNVGISDAGSSPGINFYRSTTTKSASISSGSTAALSVQDSADTHRFTVFQSGSVQVGSTTDQGYKFYVNGSAKVATSLDVSGSYAGTLATFSNTNTGGSAAYFSGQNSSNATAPVEIINQGTSTTKLLTLSTYSTIVGGASAVGLYAGVGSPEGSVTANPGSIYLRAYASGSGTAFYVKESGTGNTGWVGK